ncbi:MAG: CPBP family glutamic-type intramembrane protease [Verrucomicrobiota bacterium]
MRRFLGSEAGAVLLWLVASLLVAAVISPWLYQAGKGFGDWVAAQGYAGTAGWLGVACQRAPFGRFFKRSMLLAALLLLPLLFRRLRRLRQPGEPLLPPNTPMSQSRGACQALLGLGLAMAIVAGLGAMLHMLGVFTPYPMVPGAKHLLLQVVVPAAAVALVEEWLFRGLLLGLWLRVARPLTACLGSSLVFAFLHFLSSRPGAGIAEPSTALAGFRQLADILMRFSEPRVVAADFLTLFTVGFILALARMRTGRLWLSVGMHCGWVIAFKTHNLSYMKVPDGPFSPWWIGESLRSGLLPLAALGLTAGLCHLVLQRVGYQANVNPE